MAKWYVEKPATYSASTVVVSTNVTNVRWLRRPTQLATHGQSKTCSTDVRLAQSVYQPAHFMCSHCKRLVRTMIKLVCAGPSVSHPIGQVELTHCLSRSLSPRSGLRRTDAAVAGAAVVGTRRPHKVAGLAVPCFDGLGPDDHLVLRVRRRCHKRVVRRQRVAVVACQFGRRQGRRLPRDDTRVAHARGDERCVRKHPQHHKHRRHCSRQVCRQPRRAIVGHRKG